jgi:hypothetical protein
LKRLCHVVSRQDVGYVVSLGVRALDATVAAVAKSAGGLAPADQLLDPLADQLPDGVGGGEPEAPGLLSLFERRVRHDAQPAGTVDEVLIGIAFVGSDRLGPEAVGLEFGQLFEGGFRLADADGGLDREAHAQAMAVLHGQMGPETQLGLLAGTLAQEICFGVGGGLVGVVAAFLAFEVHPSVAGAGAFGLIPGPETLHRSPGFDQGAIHAEVLVGDQPWWRAVPRWR